MSKLETLLDVWEQRPRKVIDYTDVDDVNWNNRLLASVMDAASDIKQVVEALKEVAAEPPQPVGIDLNPSIAAPEPPAETAPESVLSDPGASAPSPDAESTAPVKLDAAKKRSFGRRNPRIGVA